jgi:very-long-chain enoyl-CoA reductase
MAFCMLMTHYIKRELESAFVHRFSSATMPAIRVVYNSMFYWGLSGVFVGYFLFHPLYTPPAHIGGAVKLALPYVFFGFEVLNGCCHWVLRNLRPPGTKVRGIPQGFGFGLVSCANYMYEVFCWLIFAVYVHTIGGYAFIASTIFVLSQWSMERHLRYKREFDGKEGRQKYPPIRKALIPFLY